MVSFGDQKKLGPRPDRSPLGVQFKISYEHPNPFHMRSPPPPLRVEPTFLLSFNTRRHTSMASRAILSNFFEEQ